MESPLELGKIWALTHRDISRWVTYKSQVLTTLMSGSIAVATWGINGSYRNVQVAQYDCSYVSFLIGICDSNLILPLTQGMQSRLNPWTLETILMSGPESGTLVLGTSLWPYTLAFIFMVPATSDWNIHFWRRPQRQHDFVRPCGANLDSYRILPRYDRDWCEDSDQDE